MDQLTRNQKTIRSIAQLLLTLKPGDRLPPIQTINRQIEVGVGTVQKALSVLTNAKAVGIIARGHMGSFVEQLDYALLWSLAGHGPVKLLLPHLDAVEFKGLSEGIDRIFEDHGIRAKIDHRQGATARMNSVLEGVHDACVVSNLAFKRGLGSDELYAIPLENVDYYRTGSVMVLTREGPLQSPIRIGCDRTSLDHYLLTQSEFPEGMVDQIAVPCPYGHLLSALLAGAIDCGIWHRVDIGLSFDLLPIVARAPEQEATLALLKECAIACLVFRKDRIDVRNLVGLVDARTVQIAQGEAQDESVAYAKTLTTLIGKRGKSRPYPEADHTVDG